MAKKLPQTKFVKFGRIIIGILIGTAIGVVLEVRYTEVSWFFVILPLTTVIGACIGAAIRSTKPSRLFIEKLGLEHLPNCAADFIELVIKKMRYRKKVRTDVMAELAAHFEDELKDYQNKQQKNEHAQKLIEQFGDAKLLGVLLHRAKKRCRSLWRTITARTFQTIGILLLCLILYCVYLSTGKPNININYAEKMTEIVRPKADESLNAAVLYQKAVDAYKEIDGQDWFRTIGKKWITDLTEQQLAELKQHIENNNQAIELYIEAGQKPYCWWDRAEPNNPPLIEILFPELAAIRGISTAVCWQAKLKAYNGDTAGAFDDLLLCYKAGNHLKGPRTLIEQLVGIAIQGLIIESSRTILTNIEVDSQTLKGLQEKLYKLRNETTYVFDFEVEKFCMLDFIQRCYTDNGKGSGHLIPNALRRSSHLFQENPLEESIINSAPFLGMALVGADREQITQMVEKIYDDAQRYAYKTPWQVEQENIDLTMGLDKWSRFKQIRYFPFSMLVSALGNVQQISYRLSTDTSATLTIIAILRYKQDKDNYPENLEQLVTNGYLNKLATDPWSDKPLIYKKTDDGFILYSVGQNFTDDGGEVARDENGKIKKWSGEGDTVFWPVDK